MRLTLRQPTEQSDSKWRKLFSRSKKQLKSDDKTATSSALPDISLPCPAEAAPTSYYPMATPRASSEYASSLGGPPEDNDDFSSPTSPSSATSPWSGSMPDSPTSSKRFSYGAPHRPTSLFSFGRGHAGDDVELPPAHPAVQPILEDDQLILTMTSKYPAADAYVPVDVSVPQRAGTFRRRQRPASMLVARPTASSWARPSSSWSKRSSVLM